MKALTRNLVLGLSILLPVVLSLQLIVWVARAVESWLRSVWIVLLPADLYFPGIAVLSFIGLAMLVGFSSRHALAKRVWRMPGEMMERIPVVNYVYGTIKDFLDLMNGDTFTDQTVVWVSLPDTELKLMGLITKRGSDNHATLSQFIEDDEVAVFLPMSYQAGGYMVVVPADQVEEVNLEPGEALRLIMSAGLGQRTAETLRDFPVIGGRKNKSAQEPVQPDLK